MEVALGWFLFSILMTFVMFSGCLFVLNLYPVASFSVGLLVFSLFAWSYSSSKNKKKWVKRHFSLFTAFCGLFVLYCFAYFCF